MKLRCKIRQKYMEEILKGRKVYEYRQIESIVLEDAHGREYEFEVKDIKILSRRNIEALKLNFPDIEWKDDLITIRIRLGKRLK